MKTDRDLSIERLLRRSLQTREAPRGDCPDVDALAAFADDGLAPGERQTVESHVADCERCQALTAAMVRTIPTSSTVLPVAEKGVGSLFGWYISRRLPNPFSRSALKWLVPATAAVTALALWVAVPAQRTPAPVERQTEVQTAAPPPPPASAVDTFRPATDARADNQARANDADAAPGAPASADAQPAAPAEGLLKQDENRPELQERVASEGARVQTEPDRSLLDRTASVAGARSLAPAPAAIDVLSSDPQVRWRVGSGPQGLVRYSADGGATWTTQETGATAPLTAGSSPSPSVCWLVGRSGTVLRSTDGGRQWQRVAFPEAMDLIAVRASSALAATVDLAGGRRLGTTDGGQTWAAVAK